MDLLGCACVVPTPASPVGLLPQRGVPVLACVPALKPARFAALILRTRFRRITL